MTRKLNKKAFVATLMIALILTASIGGTIAYLMTKTDPVVNTFEPAEVIISVNEPTWTENALVKENVTIHNDSESVNAYIRARIIVTWQDENGNVYPKLPVADTDYNITTGVGDGWTNNGDYYYHIASVAPGGDTKVLIKSCSPVPGKAPAGYRLHVEVLAQGIQADGTDAEGNKPANLVWGTSY